MGGGTPLGGGLGEAQESLVAEYVELDNLQAQWTNLAPVPYRAMAASNDDLHLYAVNVHDSTVRHFDFFAGSPAVTTWRTPLAPVSVAIWDGHADGIQRLLVVCRGTHVMLVLDRFTGERLQLLDLPFEPADLLVDDATDRAYVSCSGAREVVGIELATGALTHYPIPALQPAWMSFDGAGRVLVAPLISGNNSTVAPTVFGEGVILDLDNPVLAPVGLPDEDLFAIDPAAGTVTAVSRHAGTILFAHGINPATGRHWQLGFESLNKDPNVQTEPAHKGRFALNRLTLTTLPAPGQPLTSTHDFIDLDDTDRSTSGLQIDPARTVAQPSTVAFLPSGLGIVCGAATDNVVICSNGSVGNSVEGEVLYEFDLPDGSIPRYALIDPLAQQLLAVYCWGTNQILVYDLFALGTPPGLVLDVGHDPAPEAVQRGRELFYDASKSEHNNLTCGSCHIDGTSDQLAWNLSNAPLDKKGVLHTQTLVGIDRLAPFHWRGERPVLNDFQGAFTGLLGGPAELSAQEFSDFQAFVFSLRNPANVGADERRVLNDALAKTQPNGLVGSAVNGQRLFTEQVVDLGSFTCADCHTLPTGSNNDLISEEITLIPTMSHMETTAFNELEDKDMPTVTFTLFGIPTQRPLTGYGLLHDGQILSRFDFVNAPAFALDDQGVADVTEFLVQFDSGLAKAAHRAALVGPSSPGAAGVVRGYLAPQAEAGNISVAVVGEYPVAGVPEEVAWYYRAGSKKLVPDRSSLPNVPLGEFLATTRAAGLTNLFVGLPPGNAERFAIDFDLDGLRNLDEAGHGTDPYVADSDGDGALDGAEVDFGSDPLDPQSLPVDATPPVVNAVEVEWVTAKNARVTFTTNEPCTVDASYGTPLLGFRNLQVTEPRKVHNLLLTELEPSTFGPAIPPQFTVFHDYSGLITVTDGGGNAVQIALPTFRTQPFILVGGTPPVAVVEDLSWTLIGQTPGGNVNAQGEATLAFKLAGPPAIPATDYVLVANVVVNGQIVPYTSAITPPHTDFEVWVPNASLPAGGSYQTNTLLTGPFLITQPSGANGRVSFSVGLSGLASGDDVRLSVVGLYWVPPGTVIGANPQFGDPVTNPLSSLNYSVGDTPKVARELALDF
jgi:hypothetical protein